MILSAIRSELCEDNTAHWRAFTTQSTEICGSWWKSDSGSLKRSTVLEGTCWSVTGTSICGVCVSYKHITTDEIREQNSLLWCNGMRCIIYSADAKSLVYWAASWRVQRTGFFFYLLCNMNIHTKTLLKIATGDVYCISSSVCLCIFLMCVDKQMK